MCKKIFEMAPTQNVLRYLPQRYPKNGWWNIGFTRSTYDYKYLNQLDAIYVSRYLYFLSDVSRSQMYTIEEICTEEEKDTLCIPDVEIH